MSTEKQKRAIEKMAENGGIVSKAMRDVGYSEQTAKSPNKLTDSKGFKELCEEAGLTDNFIVESLVEDIRLKPQNRKAELELGAKMKGLLVDRIGNPDGSNIKFEIVNYGDVKRKIPAEGLSDTDITSV